MKILQIKYSDIFHISAQNIDCGYSSEPPRRGGSNEYPQSMFQTEIRKMMYTPCKPQFYHIWKLGLKGSKLCRRVFVMRTEFSTSYSGLDVLVPYLPILLGQTYKFVKFALNWT